MRRASVLAVAGVLGSARLASAEPPAGDTLAVQLKGAGLGIAIGGGIGLITGYGLGGRDKLPAALAGGALGVAFGIPIGVQRTSDGEGGTGRGWGTALGAIVGFGAAGAAIYGIRKSKFSPEVAVSTALIVFACITAGPIIGYRATGTGEPATPVMLTLAF